MVTQGCPTHLHLAAKGTQSHLSSLSTKKRKKHQNFYSRTLHASLKLNFNTCLCLPFDIRSLRIDPFEMFSANSILISSSGISPILRWGVMWLSQRWKKLKYFLSPISYDCAPEHCVYLQFSPAKLEIL